jgi:hypothetical protein
MDDRETGNDGRRSAPAQHPVPAGAITPPDPPGERGSVLRIIGNLLWLIVGGFWLALGYVIAGLVMFITIIGIPFGLQAFKLAGFSLWPFGRMMVKKQGAKACSRSAMIDPSCVPFRNSGTLPAKSRIR